MDTDRIEIAKSVDYIKKTLGIQINSKIQLAYENGELPNLVSYEKVAQPELDIPAIEKMIISCQAHLNFPVQYYDIYRSCRFTRLAILLAKKLPRIISHTTHYLPVLEKLTSVSTLDSFESTLFELFVAEKYSRLDIVEDLVFLEPSETLTPDLKMVLDKNDFYVECKKMDRKNNFISKLRNSVCNLVNSTLRKFIIANISCVIELELAEDPEKISKQEFEIACFSALKNNKSVETKNFSIKLKKLLPYACKELFLVPSPKFYYERYDYEDGYEWQGIVYNYSEVDPRKSNPKGETNWHGDITPDCAVKWKVTNQKTIQKCKRLNYSNVFKGLEQLQSHGVHSALHVWTERDHSIGHRQNNLLDFLKRLQTNSKDIFSWIVFNETILETFINGGFSILEHAHCISGPSSKKTSPVYNVFVDGQKSVGPELFGIGSEEV
ncbi:MAG: hypothetical protein KDD46_06535 [Bdellovibrionales bacterium]|nr:hypothetical protein [Bdellovibrionales bacterium]